MSSETALAGLIRLARRVGVPRLARHLSEAETNGYAFGLAYMLAARAWLVRQRAPGWPAVQHAWWSSLAEAGPSVERAKLSGRLQPADGIRLLVDGGEAFAERERLFRLARQSVDVSTYYIQADETGWSFARALAECAERGVRVRLLVDRYMLARKQRETPRLEALLRMLHAARVEVRLWHDPRRPFDSNHRKLMLVDGTTVVVGGRNCADHYRLNHWRDVDLVLEGPSVAPLARLFASVWGGASVETDGQTVFAPWFDHTPGHLTNDPTVRWSLACIETARQSLDLELPYLVGPGVLTHSLVRASRRGVRVRLLTNSAESNDLPYTNYAAYAAMRHLIDGGVDVRARRGAGRTLHSKYLVADGAWVSFGSHNLDYYSSRFCCETNLHVHSEALAQQLTHCFAEGAADSQPVELKREVLPFLRQARGLRFFNWAFKDFQ
ncbi:MAG TPA: phosphatidylserine/phosphatidylglycerophosphate/cardiolipin synthase family protein [Chloroflexota bacterium]